MSERAKIFIVIVNYRSAKWTIECINSLIQEKEDFPDLKLIVVDNDSPDDSVILLEKAIEEKELRDWVSLIVSPKNGGYAYGNNLAIRQVLDSPNPPDYIFLLNPDTRVYRGAIKALRDFLEAHPDVGIVGSSIENDDGTDWPVAFRFPNILSELDSGLRLGIVTRLLDRWTVPMTMGKTPARVDWLPGAAMMVRRRVFESVGLMDEDYFLYFEETDFCLQAKRAGWFCWYVPASRVVHVRGQSTGVTVLDEKPKRLPKYWFDSRRRFFRKNYGLIYTMTADLFWILAYLSWRGRRFIQNKPDTDPPYFLTDFIRYSILNPRPVSGEES